MLGTLLASEPGRCSAFVDILWDVLGFMQDQFRDKDFPNTKLGSVITISGSAKHAQATSCSEYIRQHWSTQGLKLLDALQSALENPGHTSSQLDITTRVDDENGSRDNALSSYKQFDITVTLLGSVVLCFISGTRDIIVSIIQQLAWMGAALRTSKNDRVQYCKSKLQGVQENGRPAKINLTFDIYSPAEDDQSCWFSLFTNPVIAQGFPVARRNDNEMGLELPLNMMAALGGARHAVDFEGGLVLKGDSTLFIPIRRHEDSVQWHFIYTRGEERISYSEASLQFPNRVLLQNLNHEALRTTRAFLGWWKEAEVHLETEDADYKSIDWSKAEEAGSSLRLTSMTVGFSRITSTQMTFALDGKEGSFHYSQDGPFRKMINRAENLPIVLYDQEDRRAWLVPALLVILHIIQLQSHLRPFFVSGNNVKIYPLDPSRQRQAAKEAVDKNKSQTLFDCESNEKNEYCFRDAVLDIWSKLDRLMEREVTTQPGMAVDSIWHGTLHGWEFRAVADEDTVLKYKRQVLKKTAGRWYDLQKEVDAVVLFASGLGDIIKPRSDLDRLCRNWRSLPKDKDYLAVCVSMLEMFYAKAGHRQDHQYLTSAKLQWHRGSMLFEQCASGNGSNCHDCDRTQQVYHDSYKTIGHGGPPEKLEANGCVVFGQAHHPFRFSTIFTSRKKALYKSLNNSDEDTANATKASVIDIDNGILSPYPAVPVSPGSTGLNNHDIRSMNWPPSRLSLNNDFLQEDVDIPERSKSLSHAQTQISDKFIKPRKGKHPEAFPDDSTVYLTEHQSMLRHGTNSSGNNLGPTQTACDSNAQGTCSKDNTSERQARRL